MFMQKVNYIHQNPVKDGLVGQPEEYFYSSARDAAFIPAGHDAWIPEGDPCVFLDFQGAANYAKPQQAEAAG